MKTLITRQNLLRPESCESGKSFLEETIPLQQTIFPICHFQIQTKIPKISSISTSSMEMILWRFLALEKNFNSLERARKIFLDVIFMPSRNVNPFLSYDPECLRRQKWT